MSEFWWGVVVIVALWIFFSMRSKTKKGRANRAFSAFDLAKPWFEEHGIESSSVMFGAYDDVSLARTPGATVLVGTGQTSKGNNVGFALEIAPSRGVVDHEILVPYGIATWHKNASMQAQMLGQSLMDVLVAMAASHRAQLEPIAKVDNFCQIDDFGFSVLHSAAWAGDNNRAIQLLDAGVNASVPVSKAQKGPKNNCEGATPLHFAVVNGCVDVAKSLLTRGASVRAVTEYDETPLHWAVGISELIFDAMLSRGANHRIRNRQGATSLHLSAASSSNTSQRWGILRDSPEEVDFGDFRPNSEKIASLCLSAGIDVNDVDYQGNTALHWACIYKNRGLLQLLMKKGGNLEQKSAKGLRPIDHTVLELNASLCKMLIDAGSPLPCLSSEFEDVALFLKSRARHSQCKELADLLLEHDLFPNEGSRRQLYEEFQRIQNENTFSSVQYDSPPSTLDTAPVIESIDMLLKSGANIDAISKTGDTALLIAAGAGGITMLKYGRGFRDCYCRQY